MKRAESQLGVAPASDSPSPGADPTAALIVVEPPAHNTGVRRDRVDVAGPGGDWHRPTSESELDHTGNDGNDRAATQ